LAVFCQGLFCHLFWEFYKNPFNHHSQLQRIIERVGVWCSVLHRLSPRRARLDQAMSACFEGRSFLRATFLLPERGASSGGRESARRCGVSFFQRFHSSNFSISYRIKAGDFRKGALIFILISLNVCPCAYIITKKIRL